MISDTIGAFPQSSANPVPILQGLPPSRIFDIPLHGFLESLGKGHGRAPIQLSTHAAGINGIARIMAGAVSNKGDLVTIRALLLIRFLTVIGQT